MSYHENPDLTFERAGHPLVDQGKFEACWVSALYTVLVRPQPAPEGWPRITHLSIKRNDKEAIHDWRHLQAIKNALCGFEAEGVELYPAESRLIDEANQFHLYVIPPGQMFPFGEASGRTVSDGPEIEEAGGKQRPFEEGTRVPKSVRRKAARRG